MESEKKPRTPDTRNPEDVTFLVKRGITPPKKRRICRELAHFIKHGNLMMAGTEAIRMSYTIEMQEKWLGQIVLRPRDTERYQVVCLVPVWTGSAMKDEQGRRVLTPFMAALKSLDSKKGGIFSLCGLEIVKEEKQVSA